jgi:exodeoxyribonuclease III
LPSQLRVITVNVNGIRAAARKGFFDWLPQQDADVVCVQEIKAEAHKITDAIYRPEGYHCHYYPAVKPGYSGVAIYSRAEPTRVIEGLGWEDFDAEGRYLEAQFDGYAVVSLYLPSGSSSDLRQQRKFDFLDRFMPHLRKLKRRSREYLICGDWNIAHKEIDLKNWRGNRNNSGFLPEERAWLDELFGKERYVDAFREVDPRPDRYTWWSNRGASWDKNVGWRIDYQVVTPGLVGTARAAEIYRDQRFSDHAPLIMDYQIAPGPEPRAPGRSRRR